MKIKVVCNLFSLDRFSFNQSCFTGNHNKMNNNVRKSYLIFAKKFTHLYSFERPRRSIHIKDEPLNVARVHLCIL